MDKWEWRMSKGSPRLSVGPSPQEGAHFTKKIWVLTNLTIPDNIRFGHNLMISPFSGKISHLTASLAMILHDIMPQGVFSDQIAA